MYVLLVMEPNYLPIAKIFVSAVTYTPGGLHTHEECTPFHNGGVWGGFPPPLVSAKGCKGGSDTLWSPPGGGSGATPPKRKNEKNAM